MRHRTPQRAPRASSYIREKAASEGSEASRVREALAIRGLSPRKRFGQNFLIREDLAERIVEHARIGADDVVVEIGPGAGALTGAIARQARAVVAVEKDEGLADLLAEEYAEVPRVEIVRGDVLEVDLAEIAARHGVEHVRVVGNIPYNITTPILEWLFHHRKVARSAVLLVQKEYAERLAAAAGSKAYGSLTVFARYYALLEPLMHIRASAFWPRPDVDSMLIRVFLRDRPPVEVPDEDLLFRIVRGSFHMRRKTLLNTLEETLALGKPKLERLLRHAGVDSQRRGETLTLEEFAKLARLAHEHMAAIDRET